ncbi:hypothetical protein Dimus_020177, partial [Dionaea muscipula]
AIWRTPHWNFEALHVPLNYKKGEDPKRYDYFEETFLTMSQLKRENGVWWLGIGENRRRDDEEVAQLRMKKCMRKNRIKIDVEEPVAKPRLFQPSEASRGFNKSAKEARSSESRSLGSIRPYSDSVMSKL